MKKSIYIYFKSIFTLTNALILIALFTYVYINTRYSIINYDDIAFVKDFKTVRTNSGIWEAIKYFITNEDLGAREYRTYGFSKAFHLIISIFAAENAYIYTAIMYFMHFISGIILFYIIKHITKNFEVSFLSSIIWIFNPFSLVKTFHHFTYLFLPIYLIFLFIIFNIKSNPLSKNPYVFHFINLAIIFSALLSGEGSIPIILAIILMFIIANRDFKSKMKNFILYFIAANVFLFAHFFHFKLFVENPEVSTRFQFHMPELLDIIKRLGAFVLSFISTIKVDLSLPTLDYEVYRDTIKYGVTDYSPKIYFYSFLITTFLTSLFLIIKDKNRELIQKKHVLMMVIISLSSLVVYLLLNVFSLGSLFPLRYGFIIIPTFLITFIFFVYYFFKNILLSRLITVSLLIILIFFTNVHLLIVAPKSDQNNKQIISLLNLPENKEKKGVLIVNANLHFSHPLFKSYPTIASLNNPWLIEAANPFTFFWTTARYIVNIIGDYEYVGYKFKEINKDQILLIGEYEERLFDKKDILIIGTDDLEFFSADKRNTSLILFNNWEDFYNSSLYYGVETYSNLKNNFLKQFTHQFNQDFLIGIDTGSTVALDPLLADKHFSQTDDNTINYGYLGGNDYLYNTPNDSVAFNNSYWTTNRYGNFKYRFTNLPAESALKLVFDFQELWRFKPGERVFDITLTTDTNKIELSDIDLFVIGGNDPMSIAVNIPNTKNLDIEFTTNAGVLDPIAFVSGIFIYKNTQNN